jgi:hypothetical protein
MLPITYFITGRVYALFLKPQVMNKTIRFFPLSPDGMFNRNSELIPITIF